jgi:5'-nucleotidase
MAKKPDVRAYHFEKEETHMIFSTKKTRIWILSCLLLVTLAFGGAPALFAQGGEYELTIIHTNDVHARVDQFDGYGGSCSEEDAAAGECYGGVARRATEIDKLRSDGGNTILVDAGDEFQGTLFFTQYKGEAAQRFMNELGYQAMAVGNHEFDDGPGTLASFIKGAYFPVISANIDASQEPELDDLIKPYVVLEVGGEQIGIVGYTTEETPLLSSTGAVVFNDIETSVSAAIDELEAMGVNKIIALSHAGYLKDQDIAAKIDGLDVIVGGHSHTLLSNTVEGAAGPYPTVVQSPDGNPVLVVQVGAWGQYLGDLTVAFDAQGVPASWEGNPIVLDASIAQDSQIEAEVQAMDAPLQALRNQVIGSAATLLDGDRASCRFGECTMGDLVADAIMTNTAKEGVQAVIINGGGLRASIGAGDVSMGDVLEVLPFGNTIATFELSGADLWAALENGVSRAENPDNEGTGRFPQVSGLRYTWNPALPEGSRVTSVEIQGADGNFAPLDPNSLYKVASNNFMRGGGDGYQVFADKAINPYDFGDTLDEAVKDYRAANSPVSVELDGRISQSDAAPATLPETGAPPVDLSIVIFVMGVILVGGGILVRRRSIST